MTRVGVIGGYCQLLEALRESARLERKISEMLWFRVVSRSARKPIRRSKAGGRR